MNHLDRPLSPKERQALWTYLGGTAAPAGGLGPEALDGFFTALVIGPETVMPSAYLPVVLGKSEFTNEESARRIVGFMVRRWNHLASTLLDGRMPALWIFQTPKDQKGSAWCRGFMWGTTFFAEAWERLSEQPQFDIYVHSIQMLAGALYGPFPVFSHKERESYYMFIRDGIQVLHDHWLVERKQEAGTMRVETTPIRDGS